VAERRGLGGCRRALLRREHARAGGESEPAELVGERGEAGELELGRVDEGAALAPDPAREEAAPLERCQRLAQRHAADAKPGGQRLLDTRRIPTDLALASARAENGPVAATFADGHAGTWDASWLRAHCYCGGEAAPARARRLWDSSIQHSLPVRRYLDVAQGGSVLRDWL